MSSSSRFRMLSLTAMIVLGLLVAERRRVSARASPDAPLGSSRRISREAEPDIAGTREPGSGDPRSSREQRIAADVLAAAAVDPCGALERAIGSIQSTQLLEATVLAIVDVWAEREPARAASLIDRLPEGDLRALAADRVAAHWNRMNPTTAYLWIKSTPESDRLLAQLAGEH